MYEETKSHGHEVPLALGQNQSETIQTLLGTGQQNNGNYITKHHAPIHHVAMRLTFLTSIATLQALCNRVSNLLPAARVC
jgi:hypothetical protein